MTRAAIVVGLALLLTPFRAAGEPIVVASGSWPSSSPSS